MTPAARLAAVIELLEDVYTVPVPAEQVLTSYLRGRRYIGSKDRRAITALYWQVLRHTARLRWALGQAGLAETPRTLALAAVAGQQDEGAGDAVPGDMVSGDVAGLFDGSTHGPEPLTEQEAAALAVLVDPGDAPPAVAGECPDWLYPSFERVFGAATQAELAALNAEAPVDLRVNRLKTDRAGARKALSKKGITAEATPLSPEGLRLTDRVQLGGLKAFTDGLFEVQDEASQIAAAMVEAAPGVSVCDLCAGAGGKTLALAAAQQGRGRLVACDVDADRLNRAKPRLSRSGGHNAELQVLESLTDKWMRRNADRFDRVLIDAPCSGTGTWRRHPLDRWRLTSDTLSDLVATQMTVLAAGAGLVKPGGRLVYVTCSLLEEENEGPVAALLADRTDFSLLDAGEVFTRVTGQAVPASAAASGPHLRLSPARTGTDGFTITILERAA